MTRRQSHFACAGLAGLLAAAAFLTAGANLSGRLTSLGRKHGRWLDTLYMQRALGPGDTAPPEEEPR